MDTNNQAYNGFPDCHPHYFQKDTHNPLLTILYLPKEVSFFTAILVYVDDLIFAGNDLHEITEIKSFLHNNFKIKVLRYLNYILGLRLSHLNLVFIIVKENMCWRYYLNVVFLLPNLSPLLCSKEPS